MNKDKDFLSRLRRRQLEVSSIPQQNLGIATSYYKTASSYLKVAPWKIIIPTSIVGILAFRLLSGLPLTHLTTLLQEGF